MPVSLFSDAVSPRPYSALGWSYILFISADSGDLRHIQCIDTHLELFALIGNGRILHSTVLTERTRSMGDIQTVELWTYIIDVVLYNCLLDSDRLL